jgi:hypothetical protein
MSDEDRAAPEAEQLAEEPSTDEPIAEPAETADVVLPDSDAADSEGAELDAKPDADAPDAPTEPDDGLTPKERRERRLRLRRQQHRERTIWTGMVVAGLIVMSGLMYLFWPIMAGRLDAAAQMDQAQALVVRTESSIDAIDKVVVVQLSPRATAGFPDVAPQVLVARRDLKQAVALLDDAMPRLTDDEQKRAKLIRAAAKSRLDMAERAPAILATSAKAVKAKAFADQAWKTTQSASAAETAAVSLYRTGKASSVASASASLQRIKGQLGDARSLYSQAASAFPGAGFEHYAASASQRSQAVKLLTEAASTWLSGDAAGASADYAAYQKAAATASATAAKLPAAPSVPGRAFRKAAGPAVEAYAKAKQQMIEADKALGDY